MENVILSKLTYTLASWNFENLNQDINFGMQNNFDQIFPEWNLIQSLSSQTGDVLIEEYWERIKLCDSSIKKIIVNLILKNHFDKNVKSIKSLEIIIGLYEITEFYFYNEVRDEIEKIIAHNKAI